MTNSQIMEKVSAMCNSSAKERGKSILGEFELMRWSYSKNDWVKAEGLYSGYSIFAKRYINSGFVEEIG